MHTRRAERIIHFLQTQLSQLMFSVLPQVPLSAPASCDVEKGIPELAVRSAQDLNLLWLMMWLRFNEQAFLVRLHSTDQSLAQLTVPFTRTSNSDEVALHWSQPCSADLAYLNRQC